MLVFVVCDGFREIKRTFFKVFSRNDNGYWNVEWKKDIIKGYFQKRTVNVMDSKQIERPVRISLHSSIQHPGQDKETHEMQMAGSYLEKAGNAYLRYVEEQDNEKIQTTVKMGNDEALIMRTGPLKMRLPFVVDGERPGEYKNAHANFKLLVKTKKLNYLKETDIAGRFVVHYELYTEGSLLGTYELSITYSEGIK